MIQSLSVTNYKGESLRIKLANPEETGFAITEIQGLGPSHANINTTEVSSSDGSVFNMARLTYRNIVLSIIFVGNDVETIRQKSYQYFPIKKKLKLSIKTSNREASIEGYVESNEPNIFSELEGTKISIICPDPYFYSTDDGEQNVVFSGVESVFEFPFSNESLEDKLIEFSIQKEYTEALIPYNGDIEIGVTISLHAVGTVGDIAIYNMQTRESIKISVARIQEITGKGFISGDTISICTVKGKKALTLLRDGKYINILNALDRDSDWPQLSKGDNVFAYTADFGIENLQVRVINDTIYEGV